ncbi:hypothetical protein EDD86DRAFT_262367, partial [Gorgonomyces haynaldii]
SKRRTDCVYPGEPPRKKRPEVQLDPTNFDISFMLFGTLTCDEDKNICMLHQRPEPLSPFLSQVLQIGSLMLNSRKAMPELLLDHPPVPTQFKSEWERLDAIRGTVMLTGLSKAHNMPQLVFPLMERMYSMMEKANILQHETPVSALAGIISLPFRGQRSPTQLSLDDPLDIEKLFILRLGMIFDTNASEALGAPFRFANWQMPHLPSYQSPKRYEHVEYKSAYEESIWGHFGEWEEQFKETERLFRTEKRSAIEFLSASFTLIRICRDIIECARDSKVEFMPVLHQQLKDYVIKHQDRLMIGFTGDLLVFYPDSEPSITSLRDSMHVMYTVMFLHYATMDSHYQPLSTHSNEVMQSVFHATTQLLETFGTRGNMLPYPLVSAFTYSMHGVVAVLHTMRASPESGRLLVKKPNTCIYIERTITRKSKTKRDIEQDIPEYDMRACFMFEGCTTTTVDLEITTIDERNPPMNKLLKQAILKNLSVIYIPFGRGFDFGEMEVPRKFKDEWDLYDTMRALYVESNAHFAVGNIDAGGRLLKKFFDLIDKNQMLGNITPISFVNNLAVWTFVSNDLRTTPETQSRLAIEKLFVLVIALEVDLNIAISTNTPTKYANWQFPNLSLPEPQQQSWQDDSRSYNGTIWSEFEEWEREYVLLDNAVKRSHRKALEFLSNRFALLKLYRDIVSTVRNNELDLQIYYHEKLRTYHHNYKHALLIDFQLNCVRFIPHKVSDAEMLRDTIKFLLMLGYLHFPTKDSMHPFQNTPCQSTSRDILESVFDCMMDIMRSCLSTTQRLPHPLICTVGHSIVEINTILQLMHLTDPKRYDEIETVFFPLLDSLGQLWPYVLGMKQSIRTLRIVV